NCRARLCSKAFPQRQVHAPLLKRLAARWSDQGVTVAKAQAQKQSGAQYGDLRRRIVFLLLALAVYRLGTHIPVPGINPFALSDLFQHSSAGILGLFNMFSSGAL